MAESRIETLTITIDVVVRGRRRITPAVEYALNTFLRYGGNSTPQTIENRSCSGSVLPFRLTWNHSERSLNAADPQEGKQHRQENSPRTNTEPKPKKTPKFPPPNSDASQAERERWQRWREGQVLMWRAAGMTGREIADLVGVSISRVPQIYLKGERKRKKQRLYARTARQKYLYDLRLSTRSVPVPAADDGVFDGKVIVSAAMTPEEFWSCRFTDPGQGIDRGLD